MVASMERGPAAWDAATGRLLTAQALPEGCNDIDEDPTNDCGGIGAVFAPDSSELIISTYRCELIALSTDDWTIARRATLDEPAGDCGLMALAGYAPDGTLIGLSGFAGDGGGWLHQIDPETLAVTTSQRAHDGSPKSHDISPSGRLVATGASDGVVRIWDAATLGTPLHQLTVEGQAQGVAFIGEDRVAVTPSGGGMLVFDIDTTRFLATVRSSLIRSFTPEECQRFGFEDGGCPTLEQLREGGP
jgi:WD40 repeat protein